MITSTNGKILLLEAINTGLEAWQLGPNSIAIATPFQSAGHFFSIYVTEESEDSYRVHDDGETLISLSNHRKAIFKSSGKNLLDWVDEICLANGLQRNGVIIQNIAQPSRIGEEMLRLFNTLSIVHNLRFLREKPHEVISEQIRSVLVKNDLPVAEKSVIHGRFSDHIVDALVTQGDRMVVLNYLKSQHDKTRRDRIGYAYVDYLSRETDYRMKTGWIVLSDEMPGVTSKADRELRQLEQQVLPYADTGRWVDLVKRKLLEIPLAR